jgi:hypothetical protein
MATTPEAKNEKLDISPATPAVSDGNGSLKEAELESHEVFQKNADGVDFRNVSWQRATIIFLKIIFATGVLSIPTAMYSLGAVGGALSVVGWQLLNTCERDSMFSCHSAHC